MGLVFEPSGFYWDLFFKLYEEDLFKVEAIELFQAWISSRRSLRATYLSLVCKLAMKELRRRTDKSVN